MLVATDLAARGIDVKDIALVLNIDLPRNPEDYVHRIGRTGRAEGSGTAISFISNEERSLWQPIERVIRQRIMPERIDEQDAVLKDMVAKLAVPEVGGPRHDSTQDENQGGRSRFSRGGGQRSGGGRPASSGSRSSSGGGSNGAGAGTAAKRPPFKRRFGNDAR